MNIFFSTAKGNVRRNDLSDFHDIRSNGKIAIGLDEGDKLVNVLPCTELDHVLLAAKSGKCIRFPVDAVRVFKSRTSDGVRGMRLADSDEVVSMTILRGIITTAEERAAYVKWANAKRRDDSMSDESVKEEQADDAVAEITLSPERIQEMEVAEEFILTVTENGYGKRTSAYEYRTTGRGGSGITNIVTSARNGSVVASLPVTSNEGIMLMTDKATVIRTSVTDVRIAGRNTQGVTILKTGKDEHVVSVVRVPEGSAAENSESDEADDTLQPSASEE
jgi:DNA gyrase subunit A